MRNFDKREGSKNEISSSGTPPGGRIVAVGQVETQRETRS